MEKFISKFKMENVTFKKDSLKVIGTGIVASVGVGVWIFNQMSNMKERQKLRSLVRQKQLDREKQFANFRSLYNMSPDLKEIVSLPLDDLIHKLQTRQLTAKNVLEAFIVVSLDATEEFNCLTEFNPKAMDLAEELDLLENPKGPLHGIPFCVKDDTHVGGMDSTVGLARNLYKPAKESAVLVKVLQELGGIPYCRTNLPQTCCSFASHNPIFGQTLNPLHKALSPGGSSSGTGCLLGRKACPFGIGSDTGGSARLPAHFCGIASLKTSKNRISRRGSLQCVENCIGLPPTPCLMGQRAVDVATIFKSLYENNLLNKYDGNVVPLAWNSTLFESNEKLRIGYYTSLDIFPSLGDTPDMILKAKSAFEALGHTLIPFEIVQASQYFQLVMNLKWADLGKHTVAAFKNEQVSPALQGSYTTSNVSYWRRRLWSYLPKWLTKSDYESITEGLGVSWSSDLWDCMAERKVAIQNFLDQMVELKLDLLLGPVFPTAALPLDDINAASFLPGMYTGIWNLLDFPAGVVQVGMESGKHMENPIKSGDDRFTKLAKQHLKDSIGMPMGAQIIGKPYHEEVVLRAMVELERYIQIQLT